MENQILVPIELIGANPYQPRQAEDTTAVAEIAESIRRNGLMQVPVARRVNGHYQLAFGHTRLAAFKLNNEPCMPVIERELTDLQMFELGIAENIKRRDLNPIEQAEAMRKYMDEFHKTSVEAGEFFNVSEEQVRGTVRLINLQPEAQKALAEGKINITAARSLLSAQKIASEKDMLEIIGQVEKGEDRWGHPSVPEEIIESALQHLDDAVRMWDDDRGSKPRASMDYRDEGWLLSMKNFPNKLLPVLTGHTAVQALDCFNDKPAQKLVLEWAEYLQADQATFHGEPPDQDYLDACKNQRQKRLDDLRKINPDYVTKLQHLLNPPACSACPFYTKISGTHFCGIKTCHTRKMAAWHLDQLQNASRTLKIELYQESDGKYKLLDTYDKGDLALFKKRHKDLRLIEREKIRGYHYQHFDGCNDNVCFVVVVGKTRDNMEAARKEAHAEEKQKASGEERREELFVEGRKRLEWEATLSIKTLFDGLNLQALKALEEAGFDWSADGDDVPEEEWVLEEAPEEAQAEWQRRIFALSMLHEAPGRHEFLATTCEAHATWIVETAKGWGIKVHKSVMGMAKRLDQELQAVTAETE